MRFLSLTLCGLPFSLALPKPDLGERGEPNHALYFMTNSPSGNSIVSILISPDDGSLSAPVLTSTGGLGAYGVDLTNTDGTGFAGPDSLFSQDSVILVDDYLFCVNPGSETVSMFRIDGDDPQHPVLVGTPMSTGGQFPNSLAYSEKLSLLCAINSGAVNGVSCMKVTPYGLGPSGPLLSLAPTLILNTPPVGPTNTTSDILFNPSSSALFAAVKGDGMRPGYIFAWPIAYGMPSASGRVANVLPEIAIDFSMTWLGSDTRMLVTDAAGSADIVDIKYPSLEISLEVHISEPANEGAACWSEYSPQLDEAYVLSVSIPNISVVDAGTGKPKGTILLKDSDMNVEDSAIDRTTMYSLTGSMAIAVIDLVKGVQVSDHLVSGIGPRKGWVGMAVWGGWGA